MEFNQTKSTVAERTETENLADGRAFDPDSPKLSLYKVVINNLLEDTYYESDSDSLQKVVDRFNAVVDEGHEVFPLKLAKYARHEAYLRDISQLLLVLSANRDETKKFVRGFAPDIIDRADEPCTVLAMQFELFGKSIPKCLKKGVRDSLFNFDKYQYSKYLNTNREVDLRDVINLTHPNPSGEHEEIFGRIMLGELDDHPDVDPLEPPETWEVVISEKGNNREAWESVLDRMGMFGKLRNLRNMLDCGVNGNDIFDGSDLNYVSDAKLYPFRFYQAYKAIKEANLSSEHIESWLSDAINQASKGLPDEMANTLVAVDLSGSMDSPVSNKSKLKRYEIASLFGACLWKKGGEMVGFASDITSVRPHHKTPVLEAQKSLMSKRGSIGHSTNGHLVIDNLIANDRSFGRIVFFTDMQLWDSRGRGSSLKGSFDDYRSKVNPEASLYMIDLASYGSLQTPEGYEGVFNVSGWSSNVLDFIKYAERPNQIIEQIEA